MTNPLETADRMRNQAETMQAMATELNSLLAFVTTKLPDDVEPEMETSHTRGYRQVTLTVTATLPELMGDEKVFLEEGRWDSASLVKVRGGEGYRLNLECQLRLADFRGNERR